jgi:hypothetical protein
VTDPARLARDHCRVLFPHADLVKIHENDDNKNTKETMELIQAEKR